MNSRRAKLMRSEVASILGRAPTKREQRRIRRAYMRGRRVRVTVKPRT